MIIRVPDVMVGDTRCTYKFDPRTEEEFLTPDKVCKQIMFEEEYMLPLHMLKRDREAIKLPIIESDGKEGEVVVPILAETLVKWAGVYCFTYRCADESCVITRLPRGYKPPVELPLKR